VAANTNPYFYGYRALLQCQLDGNFTPKGSATFRVRQGQRADMGVECSSRQTELILLKNYPHRLSEPDEPTVFLSKRPSVNNDFQDACDRADEGPLMPIDMRTFDTSQDRDARSWAAKR
jgi:hypothetical protein